MPPDASALLPLDRPYDLRRTVFALTWSRGDPTRRWRDDAFWSADLTPAGPATMRVVQRGDTLYVDAWGAGADAAVHGASRSLGLDDDPRAFSPAHPHVRALLARHPGLRLVRTGQIIRELVPTILGQLVTTRDAALRWRALALRYGSIAPGPTDLHLPPDPAVMARMAMWRFQQLGVLRKQAEAIRRACERGPRMQEAADMTYTDGMRRLQAIRGIGPWTSGTVLGVAGGHADAVVVGDLHLPRTIGLALAGEAGADDARMLELLEPFRPHRYRVLRLLWAGGVKAPRRGPVEGFGPGR